MVVGILAAAGRGVRLRGDTPKALRELCGRPLFVHALAGLQRVPEIETVRLVVPAGSESLVKAELDREWKPRVAVHVVVGGAERQDSVAAAMATVPDEVELIVVHDAARPFASPALFQACISAARLYGAAIAAVPVPDTVKLVERDVVRQTLDRARVWLAQTPQVVRADWLRDALTRAGKEAVRFTDEAGLLEHYDYPVHVVPGEQANRKLTTPEDWRWAEWQLASGEKPRPNPSAR